MLITTTMPRRQGPTGQATNELESILTAVVSSADMIADGDLSDQWVVQRELGALEDSLDRALAVVRRLSALERERPGAIGSGEDQCLRGSRGLADLAGVCCVGLDPKWDT